MKGKQIMETISVTQNDPMPVIAKKQEEITELQKQDERLSAKASNLHTHVVEYNEALSKRKEVRRMIA
jgi:hypothetical protein